VAASRRGPIVPIPHPSGHFRRYAPVLCRANFREPPQGEVRWTPLPCTRVNTVIAESGYGPGDDLISQAFPCLCTQVAREGDEGEDRAENALNTSRSPRFSDRV
jgi:hypothetical protein